MKYNFVVENSFNDEVIGLFIFENSQKIYYNYKYNNMFYRIIVSFSGRFPVFETISINDITYFSEEEIFQLSLIWEHKILPAHVVQELQKKLKACVYKKNDIIEV